MPAKLAAAAALLSISGAYALGDLRVGLAGAAYPQITAQPVVDIAKRAPASVTAVGASALPLTEYAFPYAQVPYKVNPFGPPEVSHIYHFRPRNRILLT
jgi:hypothetical protein